MQNKLLKMQEELQNTVFEGTAGGGAVTVSMTGKFEVTGVKLTPEVVDPEDVSHAGGSHPRGVLRTLSARRLRRSRR